VSKKFEYKVTSYNYRFAGKSDVGIQEGLNKLGEEGWELVSTTPIVIGGTKAGDKEIHTNDLKFVFKREK